MDTQNYQPISFGNIFPGIPYLGNPNTPWGQPNWSNVPTYEIMFANMYGGPSIFPPFRGLCGCSSSGGPPRGPPYGGPSSRGPPYGGPPPGGPPRVPHQVTHLGDHQMVHLETNLNCTNLLSKDHQIPFINPLMVLLIFK